MGQVRSPSFVLFLTIEFIRQLNGTFRRELILYELPLVVLNTIPMISYHLWCFLGGSVWIWRTSNLFRFIESQTHFITSWHATMSLTLNEPTENALRSYLHTTSKHAPQTYWTWKVLFAKQPTLEEKPCRVKDNSNMNSPFSRAQKNALRNPTDFCCALGLLLLRASATSDLSRRMKFNCATWSQLVQKELYIWIA